MARARGWGNMRTLVLRLESTPRPGWHKKKDMKLQVHSEGLTWTTGREAANLFEYVFKFGRRGGRASAQLDQGLIMASFSQVRVALSSDGLRPLRAISVKELLLSVCGRGSGWSSLTKALDGAKCAGSQQQPASAASGSQHQQKQQRQQKQQKQQKQ